MGKDESELYNEVYRELCSVLGIDAALKVFQMFRGQQIAFPIHLFNIKKIQINVANEYNGSNLRILAKKYGYSEKTIRRMIKGKTEG